MEPGKNRLSKNIEKGLESELLINKEEPLEDLTQIVKILLDKTQWYKTISIENKESEFQRFREASEEDERFKPDFKFSDYPYEEEKILDLISQAKKEVEKVGEQHLVKYGAETIDVETMREYFLEIFEEIELFTKLAANIENEESWKNYSQNIWPIVEEKVAEESIQTVNTLNRKELVETVSPEELKEKFESELEMLGMDYTVELRNTSGCKNIPEENTLVVAKGEQGERKYSEEEADMLTKHEIFHAIRAYNGFRAGRKSGFPEILGLHSPFYDRAEEGGALYREKKTDTMYKNKEFDYHLRLIAAYKISKSDNFREEFQEIAEELIELGSTRKRAFQLLARNREFLRHHIYLGGLKDWEKIDNKRKMLLGKVNKNWADIFIEEARNDGIIEKPLIESDKIFEEEK
jgi:hypothetical protein